MDRATAYPLEETTELDILNTNKFAMIGLGKLALAIIGAGPVLHGLACTPGTGLTVQIGAGQIYLSEATDATAYSSLGVDSRTLVKQGLMLDPTVLNCPAPAGTGQSINYLVQVGYLDADTGPTILPFYNASNPTVPYTGPGGSGGSVSTIRSGQCVVQIKAGAAAATGNQATPAPDAGFVSAYVVTVANGAVGVVAGNIATAAAAPFLAGLLGAHHHGTAGQAPKIDLTSEVQGVLPLANLPGVSSVTGSTTVGHIAVFSNATGAIQDGGPAGVAAAPTYLNASTTIGPGVYIADTSAGGFTLTLVTTPAVGASIELRDIFGTWDAHPVTIHSGSIAVASPFGLVVGDLICDAHGEVFSLNYNGTYWEMQ